MSDGIKAMSQWDDDSVKGQSLKIRAQKHLQSGSNLGDPGRNSNQVKSKPRQLWR